MYSKFVSKTKRRKELSYSAAFAGHLVKIERDCVHIKWKKTQFEIFWVNEVDSL